MPTTTPLTDAINALTTYANETTGASDTTLSEAVATLIEGYGQGGGTNVLTHNWDFTQSLTDTVGGVVATLSNCTQSSSGVYFNQITSRITFPTKLLKANSRIELDIASYDRQGTNHGRLLMVTTEQGFIYRSTGVWSVYRNNGGSGGTWVSSSATDPTYFDGHTLKMIVDNEGVSFFYMDNEFILSSSSLLIDGTLTIGSTNGSSAYNLTITGLRVYEKLPNQLASLLLNGQVGGDLYYDGTLLPKDISFINQSITNVSFPNVTNLSSGTVEKAGETLANELFAYCKNLKTFSAPKAKRVANNMLSMNTSLTSVNLLSLEDSGASLCDGCESLKGIVLPKVQVLYNLAFRNCKSLEYADILGSNYISGTNVFYNCQKLQTVIIRKSNGVCTLNNGTPFGYTPLVGYGGLTADLYVPSALISSYQSATNWSTILSNGYTTIHAIEGSIYETQYADGTPIE